MAIATSCVLPQECTRAAFLYTLLRAGDVSPERLEAVVADLETMPPAVRIRFDLPDLGRYAADLADRLARIAAGPMAVTRA